MRKETRAVEKNCFYEGKRWGMQVLEEGRKEKQVNESSKTVNIC